MTREEREQMIAELEQTRKACLDGTRKSSLICFCVSTIPAAVLLFPSMVRFAAANLAIILNGLLCGLAYYCGTRAKRGT